MIVVGDTSIFIGLERLDSLHLIPALYGEVQVPVAERRRITGRLLILRAPEGFG